MLLDVPGIVPCVPGAELIADEGNDTYRGRVKAKLGPVSVEFQGKAQFVEIDADSHTARLKASGNEVKGRGNASAVVTFSLVPENKGTRTDIETDVNLAGAVAQYGRAQGVIAGVAQVLVDQFAANLKTRIAADADAPGADGTPDTAGQGARKTAPEPVRGLSLTSLVLTYIRNLFSSKRGSS